MTNLLKILSLIIIISLLFLFSSLFNNVRFFENKKCYHYNSYLLKNNYPELLDIKIPNSAKWTRRLLKAIKSSRIPKSVKKYQRATILVTYQNKLQCEYLAEVRIHGATHYHVRDSHLYTSLRLKIIDGHINHISNFALIRETARNFDDEIFITSLFEELNILSPLNFKTKVKLNNEIIKNYLFVEMPSMEMLKSKERNNGLVLAGNKNNKMEKRTSKGTPKMNGRSIRSVNLSRIKNYDGISYKNRNNLLYALDKINYIYLNSMGIGNGKNCCNFLLDNSNKSLIEINYDLGHYFLNFSFLKDHNELKKMSIFNLLMNATNSQHGLAFEDRFFFYDPTFDKLEPYYRDGDPNIISSNSKFEPKNNTIFEEEKNFINITKKLIDNIDIIQFEEKLHSRGLHLSKVKIKEILVKIKNNLEKIRNFKSLNSPSNFPSTYAANWFNNHFINKNLNFNLAFGGLNNNFEICDISLKNCIKKKLFDNEFYKLLKDKFVLLDGFKKKSLYIRLSKEMYVKNSKPISRSIKTNYNKIKLENNFYLFFNVDKKNIILNKEGKKISLKQKSEDTRFVFIGESKMPWEIEFKGINKKDIINYKRNEKMIGGCVTFLNSFIKDLSIILSDSKCPKALEVLKSRGSFKNIEIYNSAADAFDSEFSEIFVHNITVNKTHGGECIGLKRGNYNFLNLTLTGCRDKAVSSGEHSKTILENIKVYNSYMGLTAKDSSEIKVNNYLNKNSNGCLHSYRWKKNYNGAAIFVNKKNFYCDGGKIENDKYSIIKYF